MSGDDPLSGMKSPKGAKPPPAMIGADQIEELKALRKALKFFGEDWRKVLMEFRTVHGVAVESGNELTAADALTLILRLRKRRDQEKRRNPARDPEGEAGPQCPKCADGGGGTSVGGMDVVDEEADECT
jgi:hypothetical protein